MKQTIIFESDEYRIFKYYPTLFHPYIRGIDNMYFQKIIRFFLNCLTGGVLYYLQEKGNNTIIGYCMVSKGKAFHYRYAKDTDITLGPIYLMKPWRGQRLSILLLKTVLEDNPRATNAYAYIHRVNKQSNALFSRMGFSPVANVVIARFSRQVSVADQDNTDYRLYRRGQGSMPLL